MYILNCLLCIYYEVVHVSFNCIAIHCTCTEEAEHLIKMLYVDVCLSDYQYDCILIWSLLAQGSALVLAVFLILVEN